MAPSSAHRFANQTLPLLIGALLCAGGAHAQTDDQQLFSGSVPPNVILMMDDSGSMREIMWHPAYDATATCEILPAGYDDDEDDFEDDNDDEVRISCGSYCRLEVADDSPYSGDVVSTYDSSNSNSYPDDGYVERTFCGQTRRLYIDGRIRADGDRTLYSQPYLEWYFSLDPSDTTTTYGADAQTAAEILAEIYDAANGREFVDGDAFGLYQRSRMSAAKDVAAEVMYRTNTSCPAYLGDCGSYNDLVRFGLAQFRGTEGGFVSAAPAPYPSAKGSLESAIDDLEASGSTPLGETLFQLYTYFMHRTDASQRPKGIDGNTAFPAYSYRLPDGDHVSSIGSAAPDPVTAACQKHFVIMLTDGVPNGDNFSDSGDEAQGFSDFKTKYVGDYAPDLASEIDWDQTAGTWSAGSPAKEEGSPPWQSSSGAGYLDDIALYMQENDLRGDYAGTQVVDVYTIGFTTTGAVNVLLSKTARNGNGRFFAASQAADITNALVYSLADIISKTQSFAAASVPSSRTSDGNSFFTSYFQPSSKSPFWPGHLKAFEFNRAGEIRDKPTAAQEMANQPGDCALNDPVPGRCQAGRLQTERDGYWEAANEIPDAVGTGGRDLYVSKFQGGPPATVPAPPCGFGDCLALFDDASVTAADLAVTSGDISDYDQTGNGSSGITTDEDLADAIVRYVRGCDFGSGSCNDRGDGQKLWDIFHASPVVVGPPNQGLREESYRDYLTRYKHRKRVLYAGTNGGFVHGFNAGEYGTVAVPNAYDRGDGAEEFGFMAYPARQNIAELPLDLPPRGTATWSGYSMDGPPAASDVWLYPAADQHPDTASGTRWNHWRTVLIGGMRQGGRAMWALDVTNPSDHDSSGGEQASGPAYPGYLWEFPCEDATAPQCSGTSFLPGSFTLADYMGETWAEPVITRVRATVNCSSGCTEYDRWVAIFPAGYDEAGDPNHPSYDATSDGTTSRAGRAVFMVDITTGEVLAMRRFHDTGDTEMKYAFAGSPAVFDLDFDGYADVAYFGDLGGNIWKWVLDTPIPDAINGTTNDVEYAWDGTDGWKWFQIFSAKPCLAADGCTDSGAGLEPRYKSFFSPLTGALVGAELWLAGGTGARNELDYVGTLPEQRDRFYVFKDVDPLERELALPTGGAPRFDDDPTSPADFVDVDSLAGTCVKPPPPAVGYYIEGEDGEKFVTSAEIFFGVVLTGSYKPIVSSDPCASVGESFLYGFNLFCGEGIFPPASGNATDPPERRVKVGNGLPTRPGVSVGPLGDGGGGGGGPCEDKVLVLTSDGESYSTCPGGRPNNGVRLHSWRDADK